MLWLECASSKHDTKKGDGRGKTSLVSHVAFEKSAIITINACFRALLSREVGSASMLTVTSNHGIHYMSALDTPESRAKLYITC